MSQYIYTPKKLRKGAKYLDARGRIEARLKCVQWNSLNALRGLFLDRGFYPPKQEISDSTIRRVLADLEKEGLIESRWKCNYPRFFLAYSWLGEI